MDLNGTAAVVCGGASGLEKATARALVEAGARVSVLDVNEEALAAVKGELGVQAFLCDVTEAARAESAFSDCGLSWSLARALGPQRAVHWLLDGSTWSGSRAVAAGLGYSAAPSATLDAASRELALRLSALDRLAVIGTKRLIDSAEQALGTQLGDETRRFLVCAESEAFRSKVDSFLAAARR